MSTNRLPIKLDQLLSLGTDMAAGLKAQPNIGLKHANEAAAASGLTLPISCVRIGWEFPNTRDTRRGRGNPKVRCIADFDPRLFGPVGDAADGYPVVPEKPDPVESNHECEVTTLVQGPPAA